MFALEIFLRIAIAAGFPEAQRLGQAAKWLSPRREVEVAVGAVELFFSGRREHLISASRILFWEKSPSAALRLMAIGIMRNFGPYGTLYLSDVIEAVAEHRAHLQDQFKRAQGAGPDSVPLEQRLATNTWHPRHGRPPNPRSQGDDIALLFRVLLALLKGRGHIDRMEEPPRVARDFKDFHSQFWRKFAAGCSVPWTEMSPQQKRGRLRDWMYQKFSLDPQSRCMLPGPGSTRKQRNEAGWIGFELNESDLDIVLRDTMVTYLAYEMYH